MALSAGTRLGVYEVVALLGTGGMGEVYRARDLRLSRDVAIKVLPAGLSADAERLSRFEQEARATAALNHPNILAVYDVGNHESVAFIVSELLDGETLRDKLNHAALPVRKAIEIALQIAHGLAAAHDKGIVHRDLKPENCFVTVDDRLKILDFGLAKLSQREGRVDSTSNLPTTPIHTQHGMVLGTLVYMAPEQVRGLAADHRADIFAFGAVLYEMLSGQCAFRRETPADTISAILKDEPPDLPTVERHIPPALTRIVDRCLEKAPIARFQTASDLAFALSAITSSTDRVNHDVVADRHRATDHSRVVERLAWSALALVLGSALIVQMRSTPNDSQPPPPVVRFEIPLPLERAFAAGGSTPIVSPNGRYVAFGASVDSAIWIRELETTESRKLTGTEGASEPFWSPDNRFLAFASQGTLKKISISGGLPQVICDAPPSLAGGTWNRDDVIIFAGSTGGLWVIPAAGGQPKQLTTPDAARGEVSHRSPQFLPDGRRFIHLTLPGNTVSLRSLDSAKSVNLLTAESNAIYAGPGYLLFFRHGSLLAQRFDPVKGELTGDATPISQDVGISLTNAKVGATVSDGVLAYRSALTASAQLQWLDRKGTVTASITDLPSYQHLAISRDGRFAAVSRTDAQRDIWLIDLTRGVSTKFTSGSFAESEPQWSPDGKELAFVSTRGGGARVYRKRVSGDEQEIAIEEIPGTGRVEDWSPDGRFLAYNFENDIWVLPLSGPRKPFRYFQSRANEDEPQFSPDGRWMAYSSTESGTSEIYIRPFPGPGERVRVSAQGGHQPRWRQDGKELFFLALDGTLSAVDIAVNGNEIVPSAQHSLFKIEAPIINSVDPYAVADNGQRFLVANYPKGTLGQPLTIVLNWTALLQK